VPRALPHNCSLSTGPLAGNLQRTLQAIAATFRAISGADHGGGRL
jgi:hypothetical protein